MRQVFFRCFVLWSARWAYSCLATPVHYKVLYEGAACKIFPYEMWDSLNIRDFFLSHSCGESTSCCSLFLGCFGECPAWFNLDQFFRSLWKTGWCFDKQINSCNCKPSVKNCSCRHIFLLWWQRRRRSRRIFTEKSQRTLRMRRTTAMARILSGAISSLFLRSDTLRKRWTTWRIRKDMRSSMLWRMVQSNCRRCMRSMRGKNQMSSKLISAKRSITCEGS